MRLKKSKKGIFKVGDKIRWVGSTEQDCPHTATGPSHDGGFIVGKEYTVIRIDYEKESQYSTCVVIDECEEERFFRNAKSFDQFGYRSFVCDRLTRKEKLKRLWNKNQK